MKDIAVLGKTYSFPEIKDDNFETLQTEIRSIKETIDEGSREQRILGIFVKPPTLQDGDRIELMERLVERYGELIASLKSKIGLCREGFMGVGEGVRDYFDQKIRELATMEERRKALIAELRASGQDETATRMEAEEERIRSLALGLTNAAVLIVRKLRHALDALEILVNDEYAQRDVLSSLKGTVGVLRKTHEYNQDMERLQKDIEEAVKVALRFDDLLRDKLGPLSLLVDEIGKVDSRVADSLIEIERLSFQLENQTIGGTKSVSIPDRLFNLLVTSRVKADAIDEVLSAMIADTPSHADFDTSLAAAATVDFAALSANMQALVGRGLSELHAFAPAGTAPTQPPSPAVPVTGPNPAPPPPTTQPPTQSPTPAVPVSGPDSVPEQNEPDIGDFVPLRSRPLDRPAKGFYSAAISRSDPTLVVFLLDQSGSMEQTFSAGTSKADYLAKTVDATIAELMIRCSKSDGIRDYFHLACIGFGDGAVRNAFPPAIANDGWVPISRVVANPRRLDPDGMGGKRPCWIESVAEGSTPLNAAFTHTCRLVARWCDEHPKSYPPTVICVTDGDSTDGDFSRAARVLTNLHTDDGETLLFNLHVDSSAGREILYPDSPDSLDVFGKKLFELSSPFPPHLKARAASSELKVADGSRFFAYRAGSESASRFFELGTRPARIT